MPSLEAEYHLENEDEDKETDEDNDDGMAEDEVNKTNGALHKKWSFRLQISSVKVSYGFGYIYWRNQMENFISCEMGSTKLTRVVTLNIEHSSLNIEHIVFYSSLP